MSDWNIVWLDDTEWVPGDDLIVAYGALPHLMDNTCVPLILLIRTLDSAHG